MAATIAIALSGGIDSLVAASLLKDQGYEVIGVHFLNGYETGVCCSDTQRDEPAYAALKAHARHKLDPLTDQLDIPIHIIDLRLAFQKQVVDYFIQTYSMGLTPNPCLVCNPAIKFDRLMHKAWELGADRLATGHYARIVRRLDGGRQLLRGIDGSKDQSYFLARLDQSQLAAAEFPLGGLTKEQTRRIARRKGLIPTSAQESQDICFIKNGTYGDFISSQPGFESRPGPIEDVHGQTMGQHRGLHHYTIGQRRGINCPAARPYYVVRLEPQRNCLVVGAKEDLPTDQCRVNLINWIGSAPRHPFSAYTQVRYRHKAVPTQVLPLDETSAQVIFEHPEAAVTPGQGAVFYNGCEVLGGGWIE